ncbi:glycosyltransferase [Curvibacter sp. CHRR-16]|uniref:glycosyltransferase n=1 Tax=Curvibacter sp. CHRR-16 TaxID=2835872 RepID=UPI001BD96680|nr:glycosyltransferase [Curvibacter sp. CHRR-16]MBT0571751.1 glycosyltransferase [Curvibacter sp. CHRR-16]
MTPRLLILCNAFDDATRIERGVTTDSPAGSRKVLLLAQALRKGAVSPWVLSLGRGRAGGKAKFYRACVRRIGGVPVVYAPFVTVPVLSEFVSLVAMIPIVLRLRKARIKGALFYNRLTAYLPSLFVAAACGYRRFLDLEDGEVRAGQPSLRARARAVVGRIYDRMCPDGALLACSALNDWTKIRPTLCYYGTAVGDASVQRFTSGRLHILMGGALLPETGADLLIDAIGQLRVAQAPWAQNIQFEVTGQGVSLARFRELEVDQRFPLVRVHGRTTDKVYRQILASCDVGLALKLNEGALAHTTFPSKVIEFAAAGLLVLSTDISDVRKVMGEDGAVYLRKDDAGALNELFELLLMAPDRAKAIAQNGFMRAQEQCDPLRAGQTIARFLFGEQL